MQMTLTPTRFQNAVWEGLITGTEKPDVQVMLHGEPVPGVTIEPVADGWALSVPVPPSAISDGAHSLVIRDATTDRDLGHFTIIAGSAAADELVAEVGLLRAELDMLKRTVRRLSGPSS